MHGSWGSNSLPHRKIRREFLKRGTAESGALKANALPVEARRLAVRAVKGAQFAFIGAKRETLDRRSGRSRRRFSAGRAQKWDLKACVPQLLDLRFCNYAHVKWGRLYSF